MMQTPIEVEAPAGGVPALLRSATGSAGHHVLMLHGWSGDEKVMWVLEGVLPGDAAIASLRGSHPVAAGGYQWTSEPASIRIGFEVFEEAVSLVRRSLAALRGSHPFGSTPPLLMGFSQGAALAFALQQAGLEVGGIIALAGFLPTGRLQDFSTCPVFWGHGQRDDLVPVERAREDVQRLREAGCEVHYCEADVGHKLGIECTRGLRGWIEALGARASVEPQPQEAGRQPPRHGTLQSREAEHDG